MKRINKLFIGLLGLVSLLGGCKKDETKLVMSASPIPPAIVTMPNLTYSRTDGAKSITFYGKAVDPGFAASANYFLEAAKSGTNFADPVVVYSGSKVDTINMTIGALNTLLLKKIDGDVSSSVDFRIRSVLVVDAGTGAAGTSTKPFQYTSATAQATITPYGLPRLDLLNSGVTQKLESPLGDGSYSSYVKLDKTKPFTLKDPDANITYGLTSGKLVANGSPITPADNGYYLMVANTKTGSYSADAYMIGLVGSATPNGWNSPDQKMDYNVKTGTWSITLALVQGEIKFRKNDGWSWNLGGTTDALTQGGSNLAIAAAGNYTITLTIVNDKTGSCTIVKN